MRAAIIGLGLLVTACGQPGEADGNSANALGAEAGPVAAAPAEAQPADTAPATPPPATPSSATPEGDTCGADAHQELVGEPIEAIPPTPSGRTWRVHCTECAVTMDYRPDRMNIEFDEDSGIIEEVACG